MFGVATIEKEDSKGRCPNVNSIGVVDVVSYTLIAKSCCVFSQHGENASNVKSSCELINIYQIVRSSCEFINIYQIVKRWL